MLQNFIVDFSYLYVHEIVRQLAEPMELEQHSLRCGAHGTLAISQKAMIVIEGLKLPCVHLAQRPCHSLLHLRVRDLQDATLLVAHDLLAPLVAFDVLLARTRADPLFQPVEPCREPHNELQLGGEDAGLQGGSHIFCPLPIS